MSMYITYRRQPMIRTNIYLTENQHKIIKRIAKKKGITFSEMFRKIVDKFLEDIPN